MTQSFDPYRDWLGIEDPSRPLDHYRLLDLPQFEDDPQRIAQAADLAMAKIRKIRPGARIADWGRLLDQLNGVKVCLMDPASKAAYDAGLREASRVAKPPATDHGVNGSKAEAPPEVATPPNLAKTPPDNAAAGTIADEAQPPERAPVVPQSDSPQLAAPSKEATGVRTSTAENLRQPETPSPGGSRSAWSQSTSPWPSSPPPVGSAESSAGAATGRGPQTMPMASPVSGGSQPVASDSGQAGFDSRSPGFAPGGGNAGPAEPTPGGRSLPQQVTTPAIVVLSCAVIVLTALLLTGESREAPTAAAPGALPEDSQTVAPEALQPVEASPAPPSPQDPAHHHPTQQQPEPEPIPHEPPGPEDSAEADAGTPTGKPGREPAEQSGLADAPDPTDSPGPPASNDPTDPPEPSMPPEPTEPTGPIGPPDPAEAPVDKPAPSAAPENEPPANAAFEGALSDARFSMAEGDLAGARKHLEAAKRAANTDGQQHAARRVGFVLDHLAEFWRGVHEAAGALQSGQTLVVKGIHKLIVVEATPHVLAVRFDGQNRRYRVADMEGGLVLAVVDASFEESADLHLLVGTFLCFDARGNEQMGRQRLAAAAKAGLGIEPFLAELEAGGSGVAVGETRTGTGRRDTSGAAVPGGQNHAGHVPGQTPLLDPAALREAEEAVRKKLADRFRRAATPGAKAQLAEKLMEEAAGEPLEVRAAMLREAQRLAVESGTVDLSLSTVGALAKLGIVAP